MKGSSDRRLGSISVRLKLILSFLGVSLIVCAAAGYGIYAVGTISRQMENVFTVASPLLEHTRRVGTSLQQMLLLGLEILQTEEIVDINESAKAIELETVEFEYELSRIQELDRKYKLGLSARPEGGEPASDSDRGAAGGAEDAQAAPVGIEFIRKMQQKLVSDSLELISARVAALQAHAAAEQKLEDMRKRTDRMVDVVRRFVEKTQANLSEREEAAETTVRIGTASPKQLIDIMEGFYENDYPLVHWGTRLEICLAQVRELAPACLDEKDAVKRGKLEELFGDRLRQMNALIRQLEGRALSREMKQGLDAVQAGVKEVGELAGGGEGIFALHRQSDEASRKEGLMRKRMIGAASRCQSAIKAMADKAGLVNEDARKVSADTSRSAQRWEVSITALGIGVGLVLAVVFSGFLSKPIKELAEKAYQVSEGDLRVEVSERAGNDELGMLAKSFRVMLANLREQTRRTLEGVEVIHGAAGEMSVTVSQLVANTATFADSVSETTSTVEQVKQAAALASEKAKVVAHISREAVRVSAAGKQATDETISKMTLIREQMEYIGDNVVKLSKQSRAIEDIIVAVQDLSDQSNLLAVNASIEAARAGDQGKGFAVVAHEIKALADQSKEATQSIRSILEETRKWVGAVVMATEHGTKAVDAGVEKSVAAGQSIEMLARTVEEAAQAASVIEASGEQQFTGVEQVSRAMKNIDQALSQHRAATSQLGELSRHLLELGGSLRQIVDQYRVS
ncbi:MAG: methyl-accepting chemotaxis protein [Pseudomonadota bacterium]